MSIENKTIFKCDRCEKEVTQPGNSDSWPPGFKHLTCGRQEYDLCFNCCVAFENFMAMAGIKP